MPKPEVQFIPIADVQAKLQAIANITERHYHAREPITIAVPNEAAADYVDKLLWRLPPCGMLPHRIVRKNCQDAIAITVGFENWNKSPILLNLCPDAHPQPDQFERIYELLDQTAPDKMALSQKKMQSYQSYTVHS